MTTTRSKSKTIAKTIPRNEVEELTIDFSPKTIENTDHIFHSTRVSASKRHPTMTIPVMVDKALLKLGYRKRKGISMVSIKSYIHNEFGINPKHVSTRDAINKYVIDCSNAGKFVRTSGRGANGSFKMNKTVRANELRSVRKGNESSRLLVASSLQVPQMEAQQEPRRARREATAKKTQLQPESQPHQQRTRRNPTTRGG